MGFGIELFEYPDRTLVQIFSKRVENFGRCYFRFFPRSNEINLNLGEIKFINEINELKELLKLIDIVNKELISKGQDLN